MKVARIEMVIGLNTTRPRQAGFTILELLTVILILSILMLIAIPAYQDYRTRARVAEMLIVVAGMKTGISEYFMANRTWPADNASVGLAAPAAYANAAVQTVTVIDGNIIIASNLPSLEGQTIVFAPIFSGNSVQWDCKGGTLNTIFRPVICR